MAMLIGMPLPTPPRGVNGRASRGLKADVIQLPTWMNSRSSVTGDLLLPCQKHDPALWFSNAPVELNLAKAYCRGCRNRQPCLAGAVERGEPTGVWGGEIFEQGRIIEFKRPRGRPRKVPVNTA
jgi:WhiB family redox-sensing transcriptional regulator